MKSPSFVRPRLCWQHLLLICSLWLAVAGTSVCQANPTAIGMVLDIQGKPEAEQAGKPVKLSLLSYLSEETRINLPQQSRISITLYASKQLFQIQGPAQFIVNKDKLTMLQGVLPQAKIIAEKIVNASQNSNFVAGAVRMRQLPPAILLVSPEAHAVLAESPTIFNWAQAEKVEAEFSLRDQENKLIYQEQTASSELALPATVKLQTGQAYRWQVRYQSARDGKQYSANATFSVLDQAELGLLNELKPQKESAIEEWILYAGLLQSKRMHKEARAAWQYITQLRPDLAQP